ncbi:hypothetical protein [Senegalia sp. (in: firmicutes)]|uniref:hypothetical protein n=1 Tax=Senegalia sp. (in: firmicutes) TaxID=1924098 RepID=UPI003F9BE9DD
MNKVIAIKTLKIIFFVILIFFIVLAGIIFYIDRAIRPTPEDERNISETNVKIEVDINDKSETRNPIIRTYQEDEYRKFSENKIEKIMDTISGNVEGDIPAVHLKGDNDIIYITFIKDEKRVETDSIPEIEIEVPEESADTAPYTTENNKIIKDKLEKTEKRYSYKIKTYKTQYEKYFLYYNIIRIHYEIDGEKYISMFGLNASNTNDGTNFFDNEDLEQPKNP